MANDAPAGPPAGRVSTGIRGLDNVLGGGYPRGHMYLVEGDAGAGKTTVGLQFLLAGRDRGERALWVTLSETERELRATAVSHGWSLDGVDVLTVAPAGGKPGAADDYSFFSPADVELSDTVQAVTDAVARFDPQLLVFDPFSDIRLLARDPLRYRRQVLALREFLADRGCTALLVQEMTRGTPGDAQAEALAHGYLTLTQDAPEFGGQRRRVRVHKMRGIPFKDGFHDFNINTGGAEVYPRLVPADHATHGDPADVSSGVPAIDAMLGGGVGRGSSLLLTGPAGVGKSTLASQYATAAADRGETVDLYVFDETERAYRLRSDRLGVPVAAHIDAGRVRLRQIDSAEFSPGRFAHLVRHGVEDGGAALVVIDSLSGYLNVMPEERFLTTHMHELLTYLSHMDVLTILTLAQHGMVGPRLEPPVDISYLADSVLLLTYFEAFGRVRRAVSVVKKRSGPHETLVRELLVGPVGVTVGEPLTEFHGVLSGQLQFTGKPAALAGGGGA